MAVYHLSAKVISRSAGRSAVAAAAYRSGDQLTAERDGLTHDYSRRHGVEHTEVMAPDNAPDWMRDRERLWNGVEAVEKRKDAQLAREVEVSLPRELTHDQRVELVRGFVRDEFVSRGMVADVAIHCPTASDGLDQPHAHVMLTTREVIPQQGFGGKNRDWNKGEALEGWRKTWAVHQNRALERAGHEQRVDHRSLEAQRGEALEIANDNGRAEPERQEARSRAEALDRDPQPKLGVSAVAMERRGIETDRGDQLREVIERNGLRRQLAAIRDKVAELGQEIAAKARDVWENLNLSGAAKAVEKAVWGGLRLDAGHAVSPAQGTGYERSRAAFERSAREVEALQKDGLVVPPTMRERHLKVHAEMRKELLDWSKQEPKKAWDAVNELEKSRPKVGKDLKLDVCETLGKNRQIMQSLAKDAPEFAREIGRYLSRGLGIGM